MIIKPKIRGFICTTAHPIGCEKMVAAQIDYVKSQGRLVGPKNVLVIGASTGYGLASRIVASFGAGAKTLGVSFEKGPSAERTATPGWYNTMAFEQFAHAAGIYAHSINGDAFSTEIKQQTLERIKQDLGQIDLVIYSLASPRRTHPHSGTVYASTLKPIGQTFISKTVDPMRGEVKSIELAPATPQEIADTIAVMGGEDWAMWIDALLQQNLLASGAMTVAYSYIGPKLTYPIYKEGTIGQAKQHLQTTATAISAKLAPIAGKALVSVNKALVTQASAAIPVVPLYISLLYKVMKAQGTHEGCIQQIERLFRDKLYGATDCPIVDAEGRVRLDDYEMAAEAQQAVAELWLQVTTENLADLTDIQGYRDEFHQLFGFNVAGVDYDAEISLE